MSTYDKNNINGIKGSVGESIAAIWLLLNKPCSVRKADKSEQDDGIDLIIESSAIHPQTIDAKLSDSKNNYLAITYRNSSGKRHPYRFNTKSHYIYVIDFDYPAYSDQQKISLENETLDSIKQRLNKHLDTTKIKLPKKIIEAKDPERQKLEFNYYKDLYIGLRTRERLDVLLKQLQEQPDNVDLQDYSNLLPYLQGIYFILTLSLQNIAKKTWDGKERIVLDGKDISYAQLAQRTSQSYFEKRYDAYSNTYTAHMVPKSKFEIMYRQEEQLDSQLNEQVVYFNFDSFSKAIDLAVSKVRTYPSKFQNIEDGKLKAKLIATVRAVLGVKKGEPLISNSPLSEIQEIIDLKSQYIEESDNKIKERLSKQIETRNNLENVTTTDL